MKPKVLIAAGGSGGHLLPAQELAELLQKRQNCDVLFAGYKLKKSPFFQRERFAYREIRSAPLGIKFLFTVWRGLWKALKLMRRENPSVVIGFGSYHTVPVLLAALLFRKTIVLYEPNRIPGKVTRLFAPFAKSIAIQLPLATHPFKRATPVPLFPWISKKTLTKQAARKELGLDPERLTFLIFGGSQGAAYLNETMPAVLSERNDIQVIHLAGSDQAAAQVQARYKMLNISATVKGYETNMTPAYLAADCAVCRSGAGTTAELLRYQLPAVLVPYPFAADDHQRHNAQFLESIGGATWLPQSEANPQTLKKLIARLDLGAMRLALATAKAQHSEPIEIDALVAQCGGWPCITSSD